MTPSSFKFSNKLLGAPAEHNPDESPVGEILALPVWTNGEQCVSLWRPSWRERLSLLFFGKLWVVVWFGASQPPICPVIARTYLREAPPADKYLKSLKRQAWWSIRWTRLKEAVQIAVGKAFQWYFHK